MIFKRRHFIFGHTIVMILFAVIMVDLPYFLHLRFLFPLFNVVNGVGVYATLIVAIIKDFITINHNYLVSHSMNANSLKL